ncbi:WG repeat-containing protein [Salinimicrobium flavum]|uniref:WG repeat-containing protein n=1 Tax=Salinimicrobium flavum TaxID=1737065 RepID=A0ABW5IY58_9FLAO
MRRLLITIVAILLPWLSFTQVIKDLELIGPENEGYIPVYKNQQWGFINTNGDLVVDFRKDLFSNKEVTRETDLGIASQKYPAIYDDRGIIRKTINKIPYYGFIDTTGKVVIEPEFLNVSPFRNGYALALKIEEKFIGRNDLLDIKIKSYAYDVVLIDKNGDVMQYLAGPFPVGVSREKLRTAPKIEAKYLSDDLIGVRTPEKKWEVIKLDPSGI